MSYQEDELVSLRRRVSELEAQVEFLYRHLGVTFVPDPSLIDDSKILEQLKKGNLIEAVKLYRQTYNTGLAESKKAVDALKAKHGY